MSKREENLAKNTLLFAIGNFGSKLLQIILVPFYTRFMTDAQYGTVDLLQAIVSLLIPVASLTIAESVFRYAMDKKCDKTSVLSVGIVITAIGSVILCLGGWAFSLFEEPIFVWLVVANTITNALRTLVSQYTRAIGKTGLFTVDNVMMTGMVLGLNIFFIAVMKMGIVGYMLGYILANLFSALFLRIRLGSLFSVKLSSINKPILKEMLLFSIPLIPNAICWWISSFLDRIMIVSMVSTAANGLYAAAHKIPSLLSMVMAVFFQAWQVSANEEFEQKDIAQFYSKIFTQMSACIFVIASFLITFSRIINSFFLGADYYDAWQFMPPLIMSMAFFSFAQFLGSIYSANKKTNMAFVTNFIAVIVSITFNLILIPTIGALGAAISNATSYFVLWMVRTKDTHKIIPIKYEAKKTAIACLILTLQTVLVIIKSNSIFTWSVCIIGLCSIVFMYLNTLINISKFALNFSKKILKRH